MPLPVRLEKEPMGEEAEEEDAHAALDEGPGEVPEGEASGHDPDSGEEQEKEVLADAEPEAHVARSHPIMLRVSMLEGLVAVQAASISELMSQVERLNQRGNQLLVDTQGMRKQLHGQDTQVLLKQFHRLRETVETLATRRRS
jgi:hypothetical protein